MYDNTGRGAIRGVLGGTQKGLLDIDGRVGVTIQDAGVCAAIRRNTRHRITSGLSILS